MREFSKKAAIAISSLMSRMRQDYDGLIRHAFDGGFDHVLVCNAGLLAGPYPAGTEVVARTQQFALLRKAH